MVEIKSKKTSGLLLVRYTLAIVTVMLLSMCRAKKLTQEQLEALRKTDSIARAERAMRAIDFQEELDDHFKKR